MVTHVSIRIILSLVANYDLDLEQLNVKTAFLWNVGQRDQVCLLLKSLSGLKQSPRFDSFMKEQGFYRSAYNPYVYMKGTDLSHMVYLYLC